MFCANTMADKHSTGDVSKTTLEEQRKRFVAYMIRKKKKKASCGSTLDTLGSMIWLFLTADRTYSCRAKLFVCASQKRWGESTLTAPYHTTFGMHADAASLQ